MCWNFSQVVGCAFYASFILGRSLSSNFGKFGLPGHSMSLIELLQAVFSLMLPATLTLMLIFFMILHTWQNAFAEMLYFGDRLFYRVSRENTVLLLWVLKTLRCHLLARIIMY